MRYRWTGESLEANEEEREMDPTEMLPVGFRRKSLAACA